MPRRKRVPLTQFIPTGPAAAFTVCTLKAGESYWHVKLKDPTDEHDRPEFTCPLKPRGWPLGLTAQQVAAAGAGHCAEGRGVITLQRFQDGVPDLAAIFIANSRQVYCVWSTDGLEIRKSS